MYIYICIYMHTYIHTTHTHARTHTHTFSVQIMYLHMPEINMLEPDIKEIIVMTGVMYTCTCIHTYIHTCINTHIYTHMLTHTHTHTLHTQVYIHTHVYIKCVPKISKCVSHGGLRGNILVIPESIANVIGIYISFITRRLLFCFRNGQLHSSVPIGQHVCKK